MPETRKPTSAPALVLEAVQELAAETARMLELAKPVSDAFPTMPMRYIPGLLLALRQDEAAVELASLLARTSLMEDGEDPTADRVLAAVQADYFPYPIVLWAAQVAAAWEAKS